MSLAAYVARAPRPTGKTLVVLHGRGDSHQGFTWLPQALGFDALDVVFLDAPDPCFTGFSWYDLPPDQRPGVERSVGLLDDFFDRLFAGDARPEDTALFGFSQGCLMTLEWGARSDRPLAAYVGVSGYCLDPEALLAQARPQALRPDWLVTHGRLDDVLPFDETARAIRVLQEAGWPIAFEACDKAHTIDPRAELDRIRGFLAERLGLEPEPPG